VSLEATVRRLDDLEAIRDLARRYAHYVWQRDASGAIGLFAEDGEMDTGDRPPIQGRKALLEVYEAMFASAELHPMVHNHVVDLRGDEATGSCYLELHARIDGVDKLGAGQYHDRYVRVGGVWKFASRKLTMCYLVDSDTPLTA